MSEQYDAYLKEHIENVKRGYKWIKQNLSEEVADYDSWISDNLSQHDASKFEYEEYDAYDEHYYGEHKGEEWEVSNYNNAWLHHLHENLHHWEHWVLFEDDSLQLTAVEMPYVYIVEMICDWWAFSWKKGNLFEIFDWYAEHHDHIYLHEETRRQVEDLLTKMKEELNRQFTQYTADMVDTIDATKTVSEACDDIELSLQFVKKDLLHEVDTFAEQITNSDVKNEAKIHVEALRTVIHDYVNERRTLNGYLD